MKDDFWESAKNAVIEKYLTYCKNMHLDQVMQWRVRYLKCRFTREDNYVIKVRMGMIRAASAPQTHYLNPKTGQISSDYNRMGPRVTEVPPLLDPDLSLDEAKAKHRSYEATGGQQLFLTEAKANPKLITDREDDEEKRQKLMMNICEAFPCVMPVIPTAQVMLKMIARAA